MKLHSLWFALLLVAALALFTTTAASALMPPHTISVSVSDGGELAGDTITVEGYSLSYADEDLTLVDADTQEPIAYTHELGCEGEGDCSPDSPPGACQSRCTLTITLSAPKVGQKIHLKLLSNDLTFTVVAPEPGPASPSPERSK